MVKLYKNIMFLSSETAGGGCIITGGGSAPYYNYDIYVLNLEEVNKIMRICFSFTPLDIIVNYAKLRVIKA